MKPHVICHMLCSIDGRIITENWKPFKGVELYEQTGGKHENADAWFCGRVTMEQHFAAELPDLSGFETIPDKTDFIADAQADSYVIALDASGKLGWDSNDLDGDRLIVVLTEKVSPEYLGYLQSKDISYLFGGATAVDLSLILTKLQQHFNINKIMLEGGGGINGSFHAAGLIDEFSILYYPIADGSDTATFNDTGLPTVENIPYKHLKLIHLQQMTDDVVWMKYKVVR
ncbi:dihydrofolate reductase family protein [Chitinophaga filiformis]|uniref:Pyrimidine reductase, riboflavin biosynthesis n=1 Tax=Chitinophaga filiformis TaxID=104663 RepID=A0A1G7RNP3_CHIFI|nr:dihydrofolate reductase family protein [Chitinophaga filiformis]SDG12362.1 Pyrimidine reductase, riboflavin biosynthesis [Chitinophaga filiformis]